MLRVSVATFCVLGCGALAYSSELAAGSSIDTDWVKTIGIVGGTIGGPAFAIWYSYYMTAVRLPEIEEKHANQISKLIENFREDIKALWAAKNSSDDKLTAAIVSLKDALVHK